MLRKCQECGNTFLNAESYLAHRSRDSKLRIVPLGHSEGNVKRWFMNFEEGPGGAGWVTAKHSAGSCRLGQFERVGGMLALKAAA